MTTLEWQPNFSMSNGPEHVPFNERQRPQESLQSIVANTDGKKLIGMEILDTQDLNPRVVFTAIVAYADYDATSNPSVTEVPLLHQVMVQKLIRRDNKPSGEISSPFLLCEISQNPFMGSTAMALDYGKKTYHRDLTRQKENYAKRNAAIEKEVEAAHTFLEGEGPDLFLESLREKGQEKHDFQNEIPPEEFGEAS